MVKRTQVYSCSECNENVEMFVDSDEIVNCLICGEPMWVNFSYCDIAIDKTESYYDKQLGAYIDGSSDRRKVMQSKGYIDASYEDLMKHNDKIKADKLAKNRGKYREGLTKAVDFLQKNKETRKSIAAEQRNTGKSAMAKKISEVVL